MRRIQTLLLGSCLAVLAGCVEIPQTPLATETIDQAANPTCWRPTVVQGNDYNDENQTMLNKAYYRTLTYGATGQRTQTVTKWAIMPGANWDGQATSTYNMDASDVFMGMNYVMESPIGTPMAPVTPSVIVSVNTDKVMTFNSYQNGTTNAKRYWTYDADLKVASHTVEWEGMISAMNQRIRITYSLDAQGNLTTVRYQKDLDMIAPTTYELDVQGACTLTKDTQGRLTAWNCPLNDAGNVLRWTYRGTIAYNLDNSTNTVIV